MSDPVLRVHDLTKRYNEYTAVDHISFEIHEGEILGLLGPNGAGKSTTIQMLLGLTLPDGGSIEYFGKDFLKNREYCLSRINFASTYSEVQMRMSVYQNLHIYAGLYNVKNWQQRVEELLELLEISDLRNHIFWKLSSGQKTRVILAKSLINRPKMLLMDEPTASLDPDIINKVIDLIKDLQEKEKITILFTSHNMSEVSRLCDRVAFLTHGKIATIDTPLELTKKMGDVTLSLSFEGKVAIVREYLEKLGYTPEFVRKDLVEVKVPEKAVPKVLFGFADQDIWITSINTERPSLEDVFLAYSEKQKQGKHEVA